MTTKKYEEPIYREIPDALHLGTPLDESIKSRQNELAEYRKNHPKPWYCKKQQTKQSNI